MILEHIIKNILLFFLPLALPSTIALLTSAKIRAKKKIVIWLNLLVLLFVLTYSFLAKPAHKPFQIEMAFYALHEMPDNTYELRSLLGKGTPKLLGLRKNLSKIKGVPIVYSGEQCQMRIKINQKGYVYIFHFDIALTDVRQLFPSEENQHSNQIPTDSWIELPSTAKTWKFDQNPGIEMFLAYFSTKKPNKILEKIRKIVKETKNRYSDKAMAFEKLNQRLLRFAPCNPKKSGRFTHNLANVLPADIETYTYQSYDGQSALVSLIIQHEPSISNQDEEEQLQTSMEEIFRLNKPSEIPRKIELVNSVLKKISQDNQPENWAWLNWGQAYNYYENPFGDRAENLEQAIKYNNLALKVFTKEAFPQYWAMIQKNLALIFYDRIRGDRAENLEQAIKYYELSLQVQTIEAFPEEWADTQNSMGEAYRVRICGDQAENLEQAIAHYRSSLQVINKMNFPEEWAILHNNLGIAFRIRIRGNRARNLEQAIKYYELSLQVRTREAFPEQWADTQNNLGNVYRERIKGDRSDNLERAIKHFRLALQVRTREAFPFEWAITHNNLANVFLNPIRGKHAENLENAIKHYKLALQVQTKNAFPEQWATIHTNLGTAYSYRIRGNKAENLEKAIDHYRLSLQVRTKEAFPKDYLNTLVLLGNSHIKNLDWKEACKVYSAAEDVGENIFILAAGEEGQAKCLASFQSAFNNHAFALAKLDQPKLALKVLEKGKTRNLYQIILLQKTRDASLDPKTKRAFDLFKQKFLSLEQQLKDLGGEKAELYTKIASEYRYRQIELRKFLQIIGQRLRLDVIEDWDMEGALKRFRKARTALVAINISPEGAVLLVSSLNKEDITSIFIYELNIDSLNHITWQNPNHRSSSLNWMQLFPKREEDWEKWCKYQPKILAKIGQWLWPRLDLFLQKEKIQHIILIPQRELFIFPLHATPFTPLNSNKNKPIYPIERYTIVYAPSISVYDQLSKTTAVHLKGKRILFLEDPDGNLDFSFGGHEWLSKQMQNWKLVPILLHKSELTSDNVLQHMKQASLIHYYGHGHYNFYYPAASGLKMYSPDKRINLLTMERIAQTYATSNAALVVLSACETGITDIFNSHWRDQYIGLPAGFLRSGARTVVGSLWPVPNKETGLLFIRFYQELFSNGKAMCPAEALRKAQLWMLNATYEQITKAEKTYLGLDISVAQLKRFNKKEYRSLPANWAAFYIVGNGFAVFD